MAAFFSLVNLHFSHEEEELVNFLCSFWYAELLLQHSCHCFVRPCILV